MVFANAVEIGPESLISWGLVLQAKFSLMPRSISKRYFLLTPWVLLWELFVHEFCWYLLFTIGWNNPLGRSIKRPGISKAKRAPRGGRGNGTAAKEGGKRGRNCPKRGWYLVVHQWSDQPSGITRWAPYLVWLSLREVFPCSFVLLFLAPFYWNFLFFGFSISFLAFYWPPPLEMNLEKSPTPQSSESRSCSSSPSV